MRCMRYGCDKPATSEGTYCDDHRPPNRFISRGAGNDLPGAGDDEPVETTCNCCALEVHAAVRRQKAPWSWPAELDTVFANDEIEITVTCSCRVRIDIAPDRYLKPPYITWSEMSFGPVSTTRTRYKVAYYQARRVLRDVDVEFLVTATCRCSG